MASIMLEISNDGKKCGCCASKKFRTYGNGQRALEFYCKIFGMWLYEEADGSIERFPVCMAAEENLMTSLREYFDE